jgi:hypothetical protein
MLSATDYPLALDGADVASLIIILGMFAAAIFAAWLKSKWRNACSRMEVARRDDDHERNLDHLNGLRQRQRLGRHLAAGADAEHGLLQ